MEINPTLFPVVAAVLADTQGRVLVQQRPDGTAMAGLWEFPGGKLEPGETPEVALVRELAEELGIVVRTDQLEPITFASEALDKRHLILLLYGCTGWKGEPRLLHARAMRWVSLAELAALPMPPADLPMLPRLAQWLNGQGPAQ